MAIYRLLRRGVFEPDDVRLLATVYEKVLCTVGIVDDHYRSAARAAAQSLCKAPDEFDTGGETSV
jgi:hypothetical protein